MTTARAPGAARAAAHEAEPEAEERVADDGWRIRARQFLSARASAVSARVKRVLRGAATAAIDAGIASLQRLRERTGDAKQPHEHDDRERARAGRRATGARPAAEAVSAEAAAPKPRRRLRGLLVYLSVMLAGGMGGTALAYELLAQLLDRDSAEIKRQQVKLAGHTKAMLESKRELDRRQAKQVEAEARLAAALEENEKKINELQAKRAEAETRLASALAGRAGNAPRRADTSGETGRAAARSGRGDWTGAGECTLGSGDARSVLKGCIADMNRR